MRSLGGSGIWELFVPGVGDGTHYKFDICGPNGRWRRKADPMASRAERPPATASVVYTSGYTWGDEDWLAARGRGERTSEPVSVYEVHLGSWRPGLSYRELAEELTAYVTEMGFTHVEFLPVAEHPFGGSWGYQVTSYYAPTARFGSPDDYRYLVDRLHQAGIGVILDWVPAHFPKDDWALARFDGTPLYENADPQRGEQPDWGTLIFDFGRPEVRNFLVANALCWLEDFPRRRAAGGRRGLDAVPRLLPGARPVDAQRARRAGRTPTPSRSCARSTPPATRRVPGIMMIAEESTAWPGVTRPVHLGGLGFCFKWNPRLDARHAELPGARPGVPALPPQRDHLLADVRVQRELRAAAPRTTRSCTARGRSLARCPATNGTSSPGCGRFSPTCGPIPASNCCSWGLSSARARSGPPTAAWTGGCLAMSITPACSSSSPT